MSTRNEDFLFAQEAQNLGYVTEEQVEEGFLLQRRMTNDLQIDERLAVILIKRGWMAEEQARRVYGIIEPEGSHTEIEGYKLVQKIGRGAMGTVYKAIHKSLHRVVAIKILRRDLAADKTQVARLKREAKLLAELDHPNIVRAFDAGESNGFPYIVMEYVEGETLRDRIAREGALSNDEALRITRALADALEKARRMGIVHRDVKPGNILISKSGTPKLMDLGLAKGPVDLDLTMHGATVGTPQFMSPEQAESPAKADIRSDIYSLGATLYAMVTTRPPFEGSTLAEIITKVMTRQPVPPRVRNEDVSPEVSHLIERMMLKDASLRYATPAQVVVDIDMIRGGQSIIPEGFQGNWEAYLLRQRWRQRKRWIIGSAAAILVLGVGFTLLFKHLDRQAKLQEANIAASDVLRVPTPGPRILRKTLELHVEQARALLRDMQAIQGGAGILADQRLEAQAHVDVLEDALQALVGLDEKRTTWDIGLQKGRYADVANRVSLYEPRVEGREPAHARWQSYKEKVSAASENAWKIAQEQVRGRPAPDLAAFVLIWREQASVLEADFIQTPALGRARQRSRLLADAVESLATGVRQAQQAFSPDAMRVPLASFKFSDLRSSLSDVRGRVIGQASAAARVFRQQGAALGAGTLLGPHGLVTRVLERLSKDLDLAVSDTFDTLRREIETLDPERAIRRLRDFENAAVRRNVYAKLARRAREMFEQIEVRLHSRKTAAKLAWETRVASILRFLRVGEAEGIRTEVADAHESGVLAPDKLDRLDELVEAAPALEELQLAALQYLSGVERPPTQVRVRAPDGRWIKHDRWQVKGVDLARRTVRVRIRAKGSRSEEVEIPIEAVALDNVRSWARRGGKPARPLADPLVDLALLESVWDVPGVDLRAQLGRYRKALAKFDGLQAPARAWTAVIRHLVGDLAGFQRVREENALDAATTINVLYNKPGGAEYKRVLAEWERLSDPEGRLRYTKAFDLNKKDLGKTAADCRLAIDQQELLQLFYGGVDIEELARQRHSIRFDFDDAPQMENFVHVFGQLEPMGGGPTTPNAVGATAYRLTLLKGVEGLLLDRPLVLRNMFDTDQKIRVEFTIDTARGHRASILAIGIDGVQVAISSMDPNYWPWQFPADTPLLDDEDSPPELDYYGRGRGIGFHHGKDFGYFFLQGNWVWSKLNDAVNFEKWKDSSFLREHRAKLFAFEPGQVYRVVVERERDTMRLIVDGELIVQTKNTAWRSMGKSREPGDGFSNGSGYIQILTTTPLSIDDLVLEGKVAPGWRTKRKEDIEAAKARAAKAKAKAKAKR